MKIVSRKHKTDFKNKRIIREATRPTHPTCPSLWKSQVAEFFVHYTVARNRTPNHITPRAYPSLPFHLWLALCLILVLSFVAHILQPTEYKLLVWDRKWIQIKKLLTTNLNNFWSSTTFILTLFSFKVVCKIWILNLTNLDTIFERRNDFKKSCHL